MLRAQALNNFKASRWILGTYFSNFPYTGGQVGPDRSSASSRPRQEEVDVVAAHRQGAHHPQGGSPQPEARRPSQPLHRRCPRLHRRRHPQGLSQIHCLLGHGFVDIAPVR